MGKPQQYNIKWKKTNTDQNESTLFIVKNNFKIFLKDYMYIYKEHTHKHGNDDDRIQDDLGDWGGCGVGCGFLRSWLLFWVVGLQVLNTMTK